MQKTSLIGRKLTPSENRPHFFEGSCQNCMKLQSQICSLKQSLGDEQTKLKVIQSSNKNRDKNSIESELVELRDKFYQIKRKMEVIEKQNQQLFQENTKLIQHNQQLRKDIESLKEHQEELLIQSDEDDSKYRGGSHYTPQLPQFSHKKNQQLSRLNSQHSSHMQGGSIYTPCQSQRMSMSQLQAKHEQQSKQLKIQLYIFKQKTQHLEVLLKNQCDEIVRLKQLLRRRNKLQYERHEILDAICC